LLFSFQAEDGIRYLTVTGVQTCAFRSQNSQRALPPGQILLPGERAANFAIADIVVDGLDPQRRLGTIVGNMEQPEAADHRRAQKIGRASCRERGGTSVVERS